MIIVAANTNTARIQVRPLQKSDHADWSQLWAAYLRFYDTELGQDVYDSTFARLLGDDPQDFSGLIAEIDGRAVGLTHFLFHRHAWKIENTCYLQDLYADPAARGLGVGRALIQAVYDAADVQNAPAVYWLTQDFNHSARKLYDRIGTLSPFIKYTRN